MGKQYFRDVNSIKITTVIIHNFLALEMDGRYGIAVYHNMLDVIKARYGRRIYAIISILNFVLIVIWLLYIVFMLIYLNQKKLDLVALLLAPICGFSFIYGNIIEDSNILFLKSLFFLFRTFM